MDRITLIQNLINKKRYRRYLEIGTYKGVSFLPIRCRKKIAVDPFFKVRRKEKLKWLFKNPFNFRNSYFRMKSDVFFKEQKLFLEKRRPDIVLVDGLHTFEASLNDVLNSLRHLSEKGVIIMHDCYPPHKAAATPGTSSADAKKAGVEGWTGQWCGDVWKTIIYLREQYNGVLDVFVLNTDMGLGVIKQKNKKALELAINRELFKKVDAMNYEEMTSNAQKLIGLRNVKDFTYSQL